MRVSKILFSAGLFASTALIAVQPDPVEASQTLTAVTPLIILDTRDSDTKVGELDGSGGAYQLNVDEVPNDVAAVGLNLTLSGTETNGFAGYVTVYPCTSERPLTALTLFNDGSLVRTSLLAELDGNGDACLYVYGKTHLTVELFGYMAAGSSYSVIADSRVLDSRSSDEVTTKRSISLAASSVPADAMVDLRVTAAGPSASGIVTVSDCGTKTFSFEVYQGVTVSHPVMVKSSSAQEICIESTAATHLLVDLRGYDTVATVPIYPGGPSAIEHSYTESMFTTSWTAAEPNSNIDYYVASVAGSSATYECSNAAMPSVASCTAEATPAQLGSDRWFSSSVWAISSMGAYGPMASSGITPVFFEPTNPSAPDRSDAISLEEAIFLTDGDLRPGVETSVAFAPDSFSYGDWVVISLWPDLSDSPDLTDAVVLGFGEVSEDGSLSMTVTVPESLVAGTKRTLAAMGTTYPAGFRETVSVAAPATADSSDGWDYVYGSPGPYDYSEFLEVYPTSDGGAFLVGQWAGDFEGMSAGAAYRLFVQRRSPTGSVAWTSSPPVASSSTSQSVYGAVDGDDVLYLLVDSSSPAIPTGTLLTFGAGGLMRLAEVGDLMSGSLNAEDGPNRMIISPVSGALLIEAGISGQLSARRIDSFLEETGSVAIPAEFLTNDSSGPASYPKVVGAFAPDGAFWLTGTIPRPLPHMEDAVGFMKVLVAADGSLSTATTVKHFGFECDWWWAVPRITDESIWVYGCDTESSEGIHAFSPDDGSLLGLVGGLAEYDTFDVGEATEDGAPYYPFDMPSDSMFSGMFAGIGINASVAASHARYSPEGDLAYVEISNCYPSSGCEGPWTTLPEWVGRIMTIWRVEEIGSTTTWTLLSDEQLDTGVEVEAIAPIDDDSMILVGSTTVDLSVRSRDLGMLSTTKRAFIDARAIPTQSGEPGSSDLGNSSESSADSDDSGSSVPEDSGTDDSADSSGSSADSGESSSVTFQSLTPDRILDTRGLGPVGELDGSGDPYVLQVTGSTVPASATAVALNVTVVDGRANDFGGFVTVYPCGTRPEASNLNFVSGQTVPNSLIAPLSDDGEVCLYVYGQADLLVDVSGYFESGFDPLTPDRILDTRGLGPVGELDGSGDPYVLQVTGSTVPASATAVALNVTVVDGRANDFGGFVTVYPCGTRPEASNLNFVSGQTVPNSLIAPLSDDGEVCLYVYGQADLLVDVSGYL